MSVLDRVRESVAEARASMRYTRRADAYRALFMFANRDGLGPQAEIVLADLAKFCHANRTTVNANETNMAILEGRRQVWLHIQQLLKLTGDQVQMFAHKETE